MHGRYDNTAPFWFPQTGHVRIKVAKCSSLSGNANMESFGKYEILKELGSGATSNVYLALDLFSNQQVALKVFKSEVFGQGRTGKAFHKQLLVESSLAGKLSHPHIVKIIDAVLEEDQHYMVMEYFEGETLERLAEVDHLMPPERIAEIIYKCCKALEYAESRGVIHRDIKPANILIQGESEIKISDFGAAMLENQQSTQVSGLGSPAYMSPEQVKEQTLTHQTDIYSLGVTMYRLLTGKLPFDAANRYSMLYQIVNIEPQPPSTYRPDLPPEMDAIVMKAMCKDTAHRYQTWGDFARDLVAFISFSVPQQEDFYDTEKFDALRALTFFKQFTDVELWEVVRISEWHKLREDVSILDEGEDGRSFFVIASGSVRIAKQGRLLSLLHQGDCFGEMVHYSDVDAKRSTDAIAKTDVVLIEVEPETLEIASPNCRYRFTEAFLRVLVKRLAVANTRISHLLSEN